ncbi:MAG: kinase [Gammaproteobacteria bacterium]|nr:kinase [Gammaproteobacteria bacterium]MYD79553.1 kinase [Gammaproteobacteria bacterium]
MRPFQLLEAREVSPIAQECFASLDRDAPIEYRELASLLATRWKRNGVPVIGLGGGQGSGKSTLCKLIEEACAFLGDKAAILGIDDFYLTRTDRVRLSEEVHKLLVTRGPPGTHDIHGLLCAIRSLKRASSCVVPVFDKGLDERTGSRVIESNVNRVIVEGWCVGAQEEPSSSLENPINSLESKRDPDGVWRNWVNQQLAGSYQELNSMFDELVFIRVPNIESVRKWRFQQELERPAQQRMDRASVHAFVEHYERITHWMLNDLSTRADIVVELDDSHQVASLRGL